MTIAKNTIRKLIIFVSIFCLVIILCFAGLTLWASNPNNQQKIINTITQNLISTEYEQVNLVRIIDGDTLIVKTVIGEQKVRLIGIDTPESVSSDESKNCEEGKMATARTEQLLAQKTTLWLSKDKSDTDQYGRLLRFVWLEEPTTNPTIDEIKTKMLNARLASDGYAQAKDYEPDTSLSLLFHQLSDDATNAGLGVSYKWKED